MPVGATDGFWRAGALIGARAVIAPNTVFGPDVAVGEDAKIGILDGTAAGALVKAARPTFEVTIIGARVIIGDKAIIANGSIIGAGSVIKKGAYVSGNIPAGSVVRKGGKSHRLGAEAVGANVSPNFSFDDPAWRDWCDTPANHAFSIGFKPSNKPGSVRQAYGTVVRRRVYTVCVDGTGDTVHVTPSPWNRWTRAFTFQNIEVRTLSAPQAPVVVTTPNVPAIAAATTVDNRGPSDTLVTKVKEATADIPSVETAEALKSVAIDLNGVAIDLGSWSTRWTGQQITAIDDATTAAKSGGPPAEANTRAILEGLRTRPKPEQVTDNAGQNLVQSLHDAIADYVSIIGKGHPADVGSGFEEFLEDTGSFSSIEVDALMKVLQPTKGTNPGKGYPPTEQAAQAILKDVQSLKRAAKSGDTADPAHVEALSQAISDYVATFPDAATLKNAVENVNDTPVASGAVAELKASIPMGTMSKADTDALASRLMVAPRIGPELTITYWPTFAEGNVPITATRAATSGADLGAAIDAYVGASAASKLTDTTKKDLYRDSAALRARSDLDAGWIAARLADVEALSVTDPAQKESAASALHGVLTEPEMAPSTTAIVQVEDVYTLSLFTGVGMVFGDARDSSYAMSSAGGGPAIASNGTSYVDPEVVLGATQRFRRVPRTYTGFDFGMSVALGVVSVTDGQVSALRSVYAGLTVGYAPVSVTAGLVAKTGTHLRDGWAVGSELPSTVSAIGDVTEERWGIGPAIVVTMPFQLLDPFGKGKGSAEPTSPVASVAPKRGS